ncbi:MAG TPA: haloacid dehalogenase type II [Terriglobia bacterium]|nr:haloacid dehalogenase type II [Terriglobia bacterium]
MRDAIGFDIYGTLVDPLGMSRHLEAVAGDLAGPMARLWREKQIEYTFRRALMQKYENFDVSTEQALVFAANRLKLNLREEDRAALMETYRRLPPFPDALPAIRSLRAAGFKLAAFSNGVETSLRALLEHAGILPHLDAVISVDDLKTYKPDPRVYRYLAELLGLPLGNTWLASSNGWDVIGAKAAGLRAAWIKRNPDDTLDPWGITPDLVAANLEDFSARLQSI